MSERVVSEWLLSAQSLKMNRFTFYYDRFWQDDNLIYVIMIHNMCICVGTVTLCERERAKEMSLTPPKPSTDSAFGIEIIQRGTQFRMSISHRTRHFSSNPTIFPYFIQQQATFPPEKYINLSLEIDHSIPMTISKTFKQYENA